MADMPWDELIAEAGDRFNIAPEGEYDFTILETEATTFKSGNAGIKAKLKVAEGPHAGKSVKTVNVVKSPKAAGLFLRHIAAVGITPDTLREHNPTLAQIAKVMEGKRVRGTVKHTEFRGETQAELEWNMRAPEGGAIEVTSFPAVAAVDEYSTQQSGPVPVGSSEDPGF